MSGSADPATIPPVQLLLDSFARLLLDSFGVGPGRTLKSARPGADGVIELRPFAFLDRLTDLVPPPRR